MGRIAIAAAPAQPPFVRCLVTGFRSPLLDAGIARVRDRPVAVVMADGAGHGGDIAPFLTSAAVRRRRKSTRAARCGRIRTNRPDRFNNEKAELLRMFLLNLYGVVNAENKVMILFNVINEKVDDIELYLRDNELFADEPTKNIGKSFTEFSIQVDVKNKKNSLAAVRYELAKRGAANINTIPIDSSIQNIDVLNI